MESVDQLTARHRLNVVIKRQLTKYSMKRITLARLTGADGRAVSEWISGDSTPSYAAFQRLKEVFRLTDAQLTGISFKNEQDYNRFFCIGKEEVAS